MRKLLVIILMLTACSFTITAQNSKEVAKSNEPVFGLKAGLNISRLTGAEDQSIRPSYLIGGIAEFSVSSRFSIQSELIYSRQGTKTLTYEYFYVGPALKPFKVKSTIKTDYINIPVLAKYNIKEGFSILAGPQVGFLTKANLETKVPESSFNGTTVENVKTEMSDVDFTLVIGVAYEMSNGVFFDARYNKGSANIFDNEYANLLRSHHSVFQFAVGYKFK